jgi:hypothetical protein
LFANPAGDELRVLRAEIEDQNFFFGNALQFVGRGSRAHRSFILAKCKTPEGMGSGGNRDYMGTRREWLVDAGGR